jgi:hypothetical protein
MFIEAGVLRALAAYRIELGDTPAAAESFATANLAEGIDLYVAKLTERKSRTPDDPTAEDEALDELKAFAAL